MQNYTHQRYINTTHIRDKWGNYDAQSPATRQFLQDFALNVWPADRRDCSHSLPDLRKRYLAGLESVWGPDHPAVQDAKRRIVKTRKGFQEVLDLSDLDNLF